MMTDDMENVATSAAAGGERASHSDDDDHTAATAAVNDDYGGAAADATAPLISLIHSTYINCVLCAVASHPNNLFVNWHTIAINCSVLCS